MKVLALAVALACAQTITANEMAGSASSSYEQCTLDQYEFIIDAITPFAGTCTKKTGYNFLKFPYPTETQKTQFCTECPDLVAKVKTIAPAHCRVNVFDSEAGVPLKEAFETLFGKCGVTNVKEEGASSTPAASKENEEEEYGSGSHDSDDDKKASTNSSGEVTTSTAPVPSPTSAASAGVLATATVSLSALGVLASLA